MTSSWQRNGSSAGDCHAKVYTSLRPSCTCWPKKRSGFTAWMLRNAKYRPDGPGYTHREEDIITLSTSTPSRSVQYRDTYEARCYLWAPLPSASWLIQAIHLICSAVNTFQYDRTLKIVRIDIPKTLVAATTQPRHLRHSPIYDSKVLYAPEEMTQLAPHPFSSEWHPNPVFPSQRWFLLSVHMEALYHRSQ